MRGEGAGGKNTQTPEEQLHLFLLAVFSLHVRSLYCTWAKTRNKKEARELFIFPLKTFEKTPKTNTSAQWDFLHSPGLFQHVFCPGGEQPHVHPFFWGAVGWFVVKVQIKSRSFFSFTSNKQTKRFSSCLTTMQENKTEGFWFVDHRSVTYDLAAIKCSDMLSKLQLDQNQ